MTARPDARPSLRIAAAAVAAVLVSTSLVRAATPSAVLVSGRSLFVSHCARCHGDAGRGDGPDAARLPVPPRDLTVGRFKYRSTRPGSPPTEEDLRRTIARGIGPSGMPAFGALDEREMRALVSYVESLSPVFERAPLPVDRPPVGLKADFTRGAELYVSLRCAACHGAGGRADGTSSYGLTDSAGRPLHATDLTEPWRYGGGDEPLDIYFRIMAGIAGAPMPSSAGAASPADAWNVAAFVSSLQVRPHRRTAIPLTPAASAPASAASDDWKRAEPIDVPLARPAGVLRPNPSVDDMRIEAFRVPDGVAARFSWDDAVENSTSPADGLAILIAPSDTGLARRDVVRAWEKGAAESFVWTAERPAVITRRASSFDTSASSGSRTMRVDARYGEGQWSVCLVLPAGASLAVGVWDGSAEESSSDAAWSHWYEASDETKTEKRTSP